jgi:hypothetical protein
MDPVSPICIVPTIACTEDIDLDESDISATLNEDNQGKDIKLSGMLTLNFQKVRCIASINLQSLKGNGRLELLN